MIPSGPRNLPPTLKNLSDHKYGQSNNTITAGMPVRSTTVKAPLGSLVATRVDNDACVTGNVEFVRWEDGVGDSELLPSGVDDAALDRVVLIAALEGIVDGVRIGGVLCFLIGGNMVLRSRFRHCV